MRKLVQMGEHREPEEFQLVVLQMQSLKRSEISEGFGAELRQLVVNFDNQNIQ
jgi:hypothetical protein